jgi:exodeoxyribonuclease-5
MRWLDDPAAPMKLTLGGYAGTGKTTVIKAIVNDVGTTKVKVAAFTGKAASVLKSKGVEATTLHRLVYSPSESCVDCGRAPDSCSSTNRSNRTRRENAAKASSRPNYSAFPLCPQTGTRMGWVRVPSIDAELVIIDEASMLSARLMRDLEMFGIKVLYVGDHGQLEPVGEDPGLMVNPDIRLETIHRQAAGSSIIRFAHQLRRGELPQYSSSDEQLRIHRGVPADLARYDVVLCGFNKTRVHVNRKIRKHRGFSGPLPTVGERVVCLRNDSERGLFNGMQATVTGITAGGEMSVVDDVGTEYGDLPVLPHQFGSEKTLQFDRDEDWTLWDFGYAMTVHKSQGSEWESVCVLEQLAAMWTASRWRYTAATRASDRLTYCTSTRFT